MKRGLMTFFVLAVMAGANPTSAVIPIHMNPVPQLFSHKILMQQNNISAEVGKIRDLKDLVPALPNLSNSILDPIIIHNLIQTQV